ncbi:hypothetical protein TNCV_1865901 [Trichonephila clavipes]|nr:hypothetical protein TNCV_1865901 [Trichonephila clavipes]
MELSVGCVVGDFTYAVHVCRRALHVRGCANGIGIAALRRYYAQFPDRRIPDHRIFQQLHHQLRETRSFRVTRYDEGRRRAIRSPSLEERILNVVADKTESTRNVAHLKERRKCMTRKRVENKEGSPEYSGVFRPVFTKDSKSLGKKSQGHLGIMKPYSYKGDEPPKKRWTSYFTENSMKRNLIVSEPS